MRHTAALTTALMLGLAPVTGTADPVVVELFTSQGCSSCPPADQMLGELANRDDVIVMSLHVDYWDWIGWKDTFAHSAYSDRQRSYAAAAGSTVVYTPQFVIGGRTQIAGAKGMAVADAILAQMTDRAVLGVDGNQLRLSEIGAQARLVLVEMMPEAQVQILHGENAGREITYHHIVRNWTDLGVWDGAAGQRDLPVAGSDDTTRVVIAQQLTESGYPGPIVGAVALD